MKIYTLQRTQVLCTSIEDAWQFFSSPYNLKKITPPFMGFDITNDTGERQIYAGMIITYKVRPLLNIPLTWVTEITHMKEYEYFVDEQRIGPYAFWHHKHFFRQTESGVEMRDLVHYALPLGILGRVAHPLLVEHKLKQIFDYRYQVLDRLYPC